MTDFNYQNIDDLIHSRIRTAIMAVLTTVEHADFNFIKNKINATDGNLSVHIRKLEDSNYVTCTKTFQGRKPQSIYKITDKGKEAFENYLKQLENLIKGEADK